jgi:hypothetical protein
MRRPAARDEEGSLIIAMAVIMVLSGLVLAVMTRSLAALGNTRVHQDTATATEYATSGLTDALCAIRQSSGSLPSSGSSATGCFTSSDAYAWTIRDVTGDPPSSAVVDATGTSGLEHHTVEATASRVWPWVVATSQSLALGPATVASDDPSTSAGLATAGSMALSGVAGAPVADLLGAGASCIGCTGTRIDQAATFTAPSDPAGSTCAGGQPTNPIAAGTYRYCTGVTFPNDQPTTLAGPVVMYVDSGSVDLRGATVNPGGQAANLTIYVTGSATVEVDSSTSFTGVIDAPAGTLQNTSCDWSLTGALVLQKLTCTSTGSGPTFTLDPSAADAALGQWQLSGIHDVASS